MKRTFASFDVFDTCLIRRCGEPYKIWDLMADKLFDKDDSQGRLSFTGRRSVVEKRIMDDNPCPTMRDIYDELNVSQWGFEDDDILKLEMSIEEQELFPNPRMLEIVKKCRAEGCSICFVSDMYLPSKFIKKILMKFGFCNPEENVYVSAECKATKNDGALFDFVFKDTNTKARQWCHYGDNEKSDYLMPKSKGVKSFWIKDTAFTKEEKRWISDARFYAHKHKIELWAGLCRLSRINLGCSEIIERAVDLISSLYIPYVLYILQESKKRKIRSLYFLARDARIFLKIAKQFKATYPEIELRYLKVSRRALYPCVFYEVSDYEMDLTVGQCIGQTAQKAVEYIGLDWNALSEKTKSIYGARYRLTSKKKTLLLSKALIENDKKLILKTSQEKRALLLGYLGQEGFLRDIKKAAVDLGWTGSGRCILNYILKKEGCRVYGTFYWGYTNNLMKDLNDSDLCIFQRQYDISTGSSGAVSLLEQYASVNEESSTIGYEKNFSHFDPIQSATNNVDEGLVEKNEFVVKKMADFGDWKVFDSESMCDVFFCCGLKQLQILQEKPDSRDIIFFSFIEIEDFGRVIKLAQKLTMKNFLALLIWGILAEPQWQAAAIKKTFGPFAAAFEMIYKFTSKTKLAHRVQVWWNS